MRFRDLAFLAGAASAGMLVYGALYEANRLVLERQTLALPRWPESLRGYRIAVLSDFHFRSGYSRDLGKRAVSLALDEEPDMIVLTGDIVDYWFRDVERLILEGLSELREVSDRVLAIPGNHDYKYRANSIDRLQPVMEELGIRLLRNEVVRQDGIDWVGLDTAIFREAKPVETFQRTFEGPVVVLWHEPDLVDLLPEGVASLQISGHSHGGQFRLPGGYTPMHSYLGRLYPGGWYPDAPTPLYVSRGVGTTGPPSRFNCPPEVSILTLVPADES